MTQDELIKLKGYKEQCKTYNDLDQKYIPFELSVEIQRFVEELIFKYNWTITADDTHRWVDSDGWYEVQFELYTELGTIYINTKSGDRELEDLWSKDNPQNANLCDCYLEDNAWDWYYFLDRLVSVFSKTNESGLNDALLRELRLRLFYGVKCKWGDQPHETGILTDIVKVTCEDGFSYYDCYFDNDDNNDVLIDLVCPMLRPLSSITIEEGKEFYEKFGIKFSMLNSILSEIKGYGTSDMRYLTELIDWLNTKQFDYNNLIELGIACKLS